VLFRKFRPERDLFTFGLTSPRQGDSNLNYPFNREKADFSGRCWTWDRNDLVMFSSIIA
jgi:hypothetical protein